MFGDGNSVEVGDSRRVIFQRGIEFCPEAATFALPGLNSGVIVWEARNGLNALEDKSEFTQGIHDGLSCFFDCVPTGTVPARAGLDFARRLAQIHEAAILSDDNTIKLEESRDR